jgi:hypothetical protein
MEGYAIGGTDGVIGHVKDCYFDDAAWVVRYLVVETGDWLDHRKVLISPLSVGKPNWTEKIFPVSIAQIQVKARYWGEDLCADALVPEQTNSGSAASGAQLLIAQQGASEPRHDRDNPYLRSANTVTHYHVHATDGDIGHIGGLLVDDRTWAVRYLVVSTSNWWGGHDVLMAPEWIDAIDWSEGRVVVDLSRQSIRNSPPYDSAKPIVRDLETGTFKHYGRDGYWPRDSHAASRPSA